MFPSISYDITQVDAVNLIFRNCQAFNISKHTAIEVKARYKPDVTIYRAS